MFILVIMGINVTFVIERNCGRFLFYLFIFDKVGNTAMTNVAPALQGSLCYISYHISIHFTHLEERSTAGRPLLFYWVLLPNSTPLLR